MLQKLYDLYFFLKDAPAKVKKVTKLKKKGKKSKYLSKNKVTRKSVDNSSKVKASKKTDVDDQHSTGKCWNI